MAQRNEGEGSRTAARAYGKRARQFVKSGRVGPAARQAAAALDSPEGRELRAAEKKGKAAARGEDPKLYKKRAPRRAGKAAEDD